MSEANIALLRIAHSCTRHEEGNADHTLPGRQMERLPITILLQDICTQTAPELPHSMIQGKATRNPV